MVTIEEYITLAPHTTFGIGGRARYFIHVTNEQDLSDALTFSKERSLPHCILAGGSNIVFSDDDFNGLVIKVGFDFIEHEGQCVTVGSGTTLAALIARCISLGLSGLEPLSGIPGTVGGAIVGNAGAYGRTISEVLVAVRYYDAGEIQTISTEECSFGYRSSVFKNRQGIIISAALALTAGDTQALAVESARIIALREKKYPPGLRCPGSFFKNVLYSSLSPTQRAAIDSTKVIEGKVPAGYLLESVGACGLRYGALSVAPYHGNLIINEGGAHAVEVRTLATELKKRVWERFGISLEEEVRYLP